ncbi:MAG: PIN domain-containing protein [Gemmatimonadales bacterium]
MSPGTVLLDTGPLVAALARNDHQHARSLDLLTRYIGHCVTSEAVVTEATHLVRRGGVEPWVVVEALLDAGVPIRGLDPPDQRAASRLMRQFGTDYADATLLVLAETLQLRRILTFDRRDFAAVQVGGAPLEIVT